MAVIGTPGLNRGLNNPQQGLNQPSFGLNHGLGGFPQGMMNVQGPTTRQTNATETQQLHFRHLDGDYQRNWDLGTLLFSKNQKNTSLPTIFDLATIRYLANMAYDSATYEDNTKWEADVAALAAGGAGLGAPLAKRYKTWDDEDVSKRSGGMGAMSGGKYSFLSTMESFMDNINFAGVAYGPPEPFYQNSNYKGDYGPVNSQVMCISLCNYGWVNFPNFFGNLQPNQELFMVAKPMPRDNLDQYYYDPFSKPQPYVTSKRFTADQSLSIDIEFFSRVAHCPPPAIDNPALLCANIDAGPDDRIIQPSRTSRFYYERTADGDVEVKEGMVWSIGKNMYNENETNTSGRMDAVLKRYHQNDHRKIKQMEIHLDPKRLF